MDILMSLSAVAALGLIGLISVLPRPERREVRVPVEKHRKF